MRRLPVSIAVASAVFAVLGTSGANAALFFLFRPTSARQGDTVAIRLGGTPASFRRSQMVKPLRQAMRVYLVPNSVASRVRYRSDRRLTFIGALRPDRNGHGLLRFTVPLLSPGAYAAAAWCRECAAYSGGRSFFVLQVGPATTATYRQLMLLRIR